MILKIGRIFQIVEYVPLSNHGSYTIIHKSCWETANPHVTWNCAGRIDCGIDEVRFYQVITPRL